MICGDERQCSASRMRCEGRESQPCSQHPSPTACRPRSACAPSPAPARSCPTSLRKRGVRRAVLAISQLHSLLTFSFLDSRLPSLIRRLSASMPLSLVAMSELAARQQLLDWSMEKERRSRAHRGSGHFCPRHLGRSSEFHHLAQCLSALCIADRAISITNGTGILEARRCCSRGH